MAPHGTMYDALWHPIVANIKLKKAVSVVKSKEVGPTVVIVTDEVEDGKSQVSELEMALKELPAYAIFTLERDTNGPVSENGERVIESKIIITPTKPVKVEARDIA